MIMELKIGDRVTIKSHRWYERNKGSHDQIRFQNGPNFVSGMVRYCGCRATVISFYDSNPNYLKLDIDNGRYNWHPDMFEDTIIEEAPIFRPFIAPTQEEIARAERKFRDDLAKAFRPMIGCQIGDIPKEVTVTVGVDLDKDKIDLVGNNSLTIKKLDV